MQKKRMAAIVMVAVLMLSTLSVSAEWLWAGYDTTNLYDIGKIYNEVIGGNYTGNVKVEALPLDEIEWKTEGFEYAYPHAGYDRLYLEGNAQQITRYNNLFPQWETRFADYFWEIYGNNAGVHKIYQRQQTNIPGYGWRWDFSDDEAVDKSLCVRTNRVADVKESFKIIGVGPFNLKGEVICDEEILAMYDRFGVNNNIFDIIPDTKDIVDGSFFSEENLSQKDGYGKYVVTDEDIAAMAGSIVSKVLTGPSYVGAGVEVKDVAAEYLKNGDVWDWDWDTVKYGGAQVSWTAPMYEMREPYKMYQYLIINGLVFDGRADLPRIYRYTGGVATPKVEWKYAFAELAAPHSVIEFKYVDGKLAIDEVTGEPIYRVPTGEYAKVYAKSTAKDVEIWLKDANADVKIASIPRTSTTGYYNGYVGGANFVAN